MSTIKLEPSWLREIGSEFNLDYMKRVKAFLASELAKGKTIHPHGSDIFSALNACPFDQTKVVIMGQDPYHGPGQAHGMSFSVKPGIRIPPSLQNIYKEIRNDLNIEMPSHGYLMDWAQQGVLLLNAVLTVESGMAGSHRGKGWETLTDKIVSTLNEKKAHLVFLLWGRDAQKKGEHIDRTKHLVLESAHPSPLSQGRFFGHRHFSKTNAYLVEHGETPIDWAIRPLASA